MSILEFLKGVSSYDSRLKISGLPNQYFSDAKKICQKRLIKKPKIDQKNTTNITIPRYFRKSGQKKNENKNYIKVKTFNEINFCELISFSPIISAVFLQL